MLGSALRTTFAAAGLMQVEVPHASHRLVSLGLLELYVRFNKVAAQNPHALHKILAFFLSTNGISHADTVTILPHSS